MNDVKETLKTYLKDYLRDTDRPTTTPFRCINPNHEDVHPSMSYNEKKNVVHCFSCGKSYDLYGVIGIDYNLTDFKDQLKKASELFNVPLSNNTTNNGNLPGNSAKDPQNALNELSQQKKIDNYNQERIKEAIELFKTSNLAQDYLIKRGINYETAQALNVGFTQGIKNHNCLLFPTGVNKYCYRIIDDLQPGEKKSGCSKKANQEENTGIFNIEALEETAPGFVYVCEAPIDALSVYEVNKNAIALTSCTTQGPLIDYLKQNKINKTLVLCFDRDTPGQTAQDKLINVLKANNVNYRRFNWDNAPQGVKDMNDYLLHDRNAFNKALEDAQADHDDVQVYLQRDFLKVIQENHDREEINTGFSIIDSNGGLQRGLYVLASISSLGKTTFAHQIADHVATKGVNVLYFSLEQSKDELVSKSLNRFYYSTMKRDNKVNSLEIRKKNADIDYNTLIKQYSNQLKGKFKIIEGNFEFNFQSLVNITTNFVNDNKETVVILDYLQILDYESKLHLSDKEKTDHVITGLKKLSRDLNVPIIAISSLNRNNYLETFSYEALKESGSIEYTADVVWGLQLTALDDETFLDLKEKKGTITKQREYINKAKEEIPRRVKLVCLKNRYGKPSYNTYLQYDCIHDYLTENASEQPKKTTNNVVWK